MLYILNYNVLDFEIQVIIVSGDFKIVTYRGVKIGVWDVGLSARCDFCVSVYIYIFFF